MKWMMAAITLVIVSTAIGASSFGQSPAVGPTALTLIVDSSWSCDRFSAEFRTLARQATRTLEPGDHLEILSARPSHPRIELAHTIRKGDAAEAKMIDTALERIHAQFLSQASVANALETAFTRLQMICSKRHFERVVVIVLTDGRLDRHQIPRILAIADRFDKNRWSLYVTGTRDTARDILVAAHNSRFIWSSISEANPSLWLDRQADVPASRTDEAPKTTVVAPAPPKPEPTDIPVVRDALKKPALGPRRTQTAQEQAYSITTRIDAITSVEALAESPGDERPALPARAVVEPNQATETAAVEPPTVLPIEPPKDPEPSRWAPLKEVMRRWWWLIPIAVVFGGFAFVISRNVLGPARRWDGKAKATLKAGSRDEPGMLVATCNGHSYHLGPADSFHSANVGRGVGNTIRLADESVEDTHVRISRKGSNFVLKNISKTPVSVGVDQVRPGGKHRFVIPADIRINDKTRLSLRLIRNESRPSETRSAENENAKS
jgi:hypothetical protein